MLIVCDMDGTIADCRHRQHLVPDWDAFHKLMHKDKPFTAVLQVLQVLLSRESNLLFITGRPEEYRTVTEDWLSHHCGFDKHDDYMDLLMRPTDDYSSDIDLKPRLLKEWMFENASATDPNQMMLMLDDRDKMVARWRDLGYTCFQTAEGAF